MIWGPWPHRILSRWSKNTPSCNSSPNTIPLIKQYLAEGNNPDQPGRLVPWLYPRTAVYIWRVPGLWFDIGSKETLEEANQIFAKFTKK